MQGRLEPRESQSLGLSPVLLKPVPSLLGMAPTPVDTSTSATPPLELDVYVMSAGTTHPQES